MIKGFSIVDFSQQQQNQKKKTQIGFFKFYIYTLDIIIFYYKT